MSLSHGGGGTSFVSSQYFVGTFIWVGISKTSFWCILKIRFDA
jgi:hypothetical protein